MIGGMLRILVVGLVMLVAALLLLPDEPVPPPDVATVLPEPRELPATSLIDHDGGAFSTTDLAGEFTLLFFGFTHCPDICPLTLQVLAAARTEIESRAPALTPRVVFVSVDPHRDTPDRIRAYVRNFHPEFVGVTAADETLAPMLGTLGVMVHKNELDGERYNVVHNGTVYVLDAAGRWIALFGGSSHDPSTLATDFLRIRRAPSRSPPR